MSLAELAELGRPEEAAELLTHAATVRPGLGMTVVVPRPEELARLAGLSVEEYSLARAIAAEGYIPPSSGADAGGYIGQTAGRVLKAQCMANEAEARGGGLTSLLTSHTGNYGSQGSVVGYASTAHDPTRWDGEIARFVLSGRVPDLARGGRQFVPPASYLHGGPVMQNGVEIPGWHALLESRFSDSEWIGHVPAVNTYWCVVWRRQDDLAARMRSRLALQDAVSRGDVGPEPGNPDGSWLSKLATVCGLTALMGLAQRYIA